MNNKGQVMIYTTMLAIIVVILALNLAPVIKDFNDIARNETTDSSIGLNCTSTLISDYDKAACTGLDMGLSLFFLSLLAIAGLIIGAKVIYGS